MEYRRSACLSNPEISRYGRQLILPEFGGIRTQERLKQSKILVIGAGGLGAPLLLYLAGAGIGTLGIIDDDDVDFSNLHRQIIHNAERSGENKAISARTACLALNPFVDCKAFTTRFTATNALEIAAEFDVLVDATDSVASKYLVNDVGISLGKPVVSGAAVRMEGQLSVFGFQGGPCYRCIFPIPPPQETVLRCQDGGVLGPVPGIIGTLQAMEVIKIIGKLDGVLAGKMLLYEAMDAKFRNVKLRARRQDCEVCGDQAVMERNAGNIRLPVMTVAKACGNLGKSEEIRGTSFTSVPVEILWERIQKGEKMLLVDVREEIQFNIVSLPQAVNFPVSKFQDNIQSLREMQSQQGNTDMFLICRRGIFSRTCAQLLAAEGLDKVYNVEGGLEAWAERIDSKFPRY